MSFETQRSELLKKKIQSLRMSSYIGVGFGISSYIGVQEICEGGQGEWLLRLSCHSQSTFNNVPVQAWAPRCAGECRSASRLEECEWRCYQRCWGDCSGRSEHQISRFRQAQAGSWGAGWVLTSLELLCKAALRNIQRRESAQTWPPDLSLHGTTDAHPAIPDNLLTVCRSLSSLKPDGMEIQRAAIHQERGS